MTESLVPEVTSALALNAADRQRFRNGFYTTNALKLGLFGANCKSSKIYTTVPERWSGTVDDGRRLAQLCDDWGIEFLLPLSRWKGYGGATDYQGTSLETITWATARLASSQRVCVFGTVHVPLFHPLIAAKQTVTADPTGHGRFGLNIVAGWNEGEFKMFGVTQQDHDGRYAQAQEWIDVVRTTWERDDFNFEGDFYKLEGVREKPKPYGGMRPVIVNAGQTATGRNFALKNSDLYFTVRPLATDLQPLIDEVRPLKRPRARTVAISTCARSSVSRAGRREPRPRSTFGTASTRKPTGMPWTRA